MILTLLLLSTPQSRPLSTTIGEQADDPQNIPFSSPVSFLSWEIMLLVFYCFSVHIFTGFFFCMLTNLQESSLNDDECKGLDGEECLIRRSLAAHTDYIYTQENVAP